MKEREGGEWQKLSKNMRRLKSERNNVTWDEEYGVAPSSRVSEAIETSFYILIILPVEIVKNSKPICK